MSALAGRSVNNTMTIAFCDGKVVNAGIGLACQVTHRIMTEKT